MLFANAEAVTGSAVAEMNDDYTKATMQVANTIEQYANLDPFSPDRPAIVKVMQIA